MTIPVGLEARRPLPHHTCDPCELAQSVARGEGDAGVLHPLAGKPCSPSFATRHSAPAHRSVSPAVQQHAAVLCAQGHPGGRPVPGEDPHRCGRNEGERHPTHCQASSQGWDRVWGTAGWSVLSSQSKNPNLADPGPTWRWQRLGSELSHVGAHRPGRLFGAVPTPAWPLSAFPINHPSALTTFIRA